MQARGTARLLVVVAMAFGAATAACTSTTTGAQNSSSGGGSGSSSGSGSGGGSGSSSGGGSSGGSAPLTCLGILQCVQTNNCSADACVNGCMAQGTSDAQQQVTDLANCYTNASCSDSACLQANCPSQLQACLSGSTPPQTGQPSSGNAPAGSVPADFVGSWTAGDAFDLTSEQQFDFGADGSGAFTEANTGGLGDCESTVSTKYAGTAVIDENAATITIYATDVTETTNACGQSSTVPQPAKTLSFTYEPDPQNDGGIMITDSDCASQYSGDQASINLYCRYTYRKQ